MPLFKNLTNKRFGRLVALNPIKIKMGKRSRIFWECLCDCGNKKTVDLINLRNGHNVSCGCYRREIKLLPYEESAFKSIYKRYKKQAKQRSLEFNLEEEQFKKLIQQDCHYCGKSPNQVQKNNNNNGNFIYNGVDRINSSLGYFIENCVPCCGECNRIKSNMTQQEFYNMIKRIYNHIRVDDFI